MKHLNLHMDANGHVQTKGCAGVMGDHNALTLTIEMERPPQNAVYYRLLFAGDSQSIITQQLFCQENILSYTLPAEVTSLGNTVFVQLCGYKTTATETLLLFKSDAVPLALGSSLPDTSDIADSVFTDELSQILDQLETFSQTFQMQVGTVTTLPAGSNATVSISSSNNVYTLNFGIPKGASGVDSLIAGNGIQLSGNTISVDPATVQQTLTPGSRISIIDGVIAADSRAIVYNGVSNRYDYIGIQESRTVAELAGTVFFVNPIYTNAGVNATFYTTGENIYHSLYCFSENGLTTTLPAGCVCPGRLMVIYVNGSGQPIYVNPYIPPEEKENGLPIYTLTVSGTGTAFPQLSLTGAVDSDFSGGKTVIGMAAADISLDGVSWFGPLMCPVTVFNGSQWVSSSTIAGKVIKAGQPVFLYLEYEQDGHHYNNVRLLNVPADPPAIPADDWHTLSVNSAISADFDPLTLYYKKSGDTVTVRFTGSSKAELTADTLLATLPEGYRPTYAYDDGLPILTCNYFSGKITFCLYSNGSLYFTKSLNGGENMSDLGWNTTQFTFTV